MRRASLRSWTTSGSGAACASAGGSASSPPSPRSSALRWSRSSWSSSGVRCSSGMPARRPQGVAPTSDALAALDVLGKPWRTTCMSTLTSAVVISASGSSALNCAASCCCADRVGAAAAAGGALGRGGREPEQRLEELLREVAPHRVHLRVELARHRRERRAVAEQLLRGELLQRAEERAHGARHRELGARLLSAPRMRDERRKELGPFVRPVVARDLGAEHRELHGDLPVALAHRRLGEHERFEPRAFVGRDHAHVGAAARPPRALHGVLEADHRHQPPLHVERVAARDDLAEHVDEARDLLALPQRRVGRLAHRVVDVQRLLDQRVHGRRVLRVERRRQLHTTPRRDTLQFKYGPYHAAPRHFDGDRDSRQFGQGDWLESWQFDLK